MAESFLLAAGPPFWGKFLKTGPGGPRQLLFVNEIAIRNQTIGGQVDEYIGVRLIGFQLVRYYFAYIAFMALNSPACDVFRMHKS